MEIFFLSFFGISIFVALFQIVHIQLLEPKTKKCEIDLVFLLYWPRCSQILIKKNLKCSSVVLFWCLLRQQGENKGEEQNENKEEEEGGEQEEEKKPDEQNVLQLYHQSHYLNFLAYEGHCLLLWDLLINVMQWYEAFSYSGSSVTTITLYLNDYFDDRLSWFLLKIINLIEIYCFDDCWCLTNLLNCSIIYYDNILIYLSILYVQKLQ